MNYYIYREGIDLNGRVRKREDSDATKTVTDLNVEGRRRSD